MRFVKPRSSTVKYAAVIILTLPVLYGLDVVLENALAESAPLIAVYSLVMAPIGYFLKKRLDEKDERTRASQNLYTELNDTLNALDDDVPERLRMVKFKNARYLFVNRMLNHDFYDSLIFSGKINFLSVGVQQQTQDIFQKIKDHNIFLMKIKNMEENLCQTDDIGQQIQRYYAALERTEGELVREIPKLKNKLKEEFKIH